MSQLESQSLLDNFEITDGWHKDGRYQVQDPNAAVVTTKVYQSVEGV